ncbi:MAG: CDP-diacylglycerol--glycerol-3-phosphate 3-phosphatidyltransferase [Hyphomicrobium aestuarii]|nr:CDP-diacylglycerol--glycerol-3-phosphate 3-phosphatidyltransferase [Hyphomicrobium aestuarii]
MDQIVDPTAHGALRERRLLLSLPNVLTYGRIAAVPAVVVVLYAIEGDARHWVAFTLFVIASLTDWLDGYLARAWQQQSLIGRMLDPIADKLLVGATLLMLVYDRTIVGPAIFAAAIILCREILVSGLREFLAQLNVKVRVSKLAKWKTAVQMIAIAMLLAGSAGEKLVPGLTVAGVALLWLAALLTLWTGYGYLRAAISRAVDEAR